MNAIDVNSTILLWKVWLSKSTESKTKFAKFFNWNEFILMFESIITLLNCQFLFYPNSDLNLTLDLRLAKSLCLLFNQNMVIYAIRVFSCKELIWEISQYRYLWSRVLALLIGIDRYLHVGPLAGCVNDCNAVKAWLERSFDDVHLVLLTNDQATRANILTALQNLAKDRRIQKNDPVLIFFAGHGADH